MPRPGPKSTSNESSLDRFLLLLGSDTLILLERTVLQVLESLLLIVGSHFEDQSREERSGE